jgi:hypothetical protein
MLLLVAVPAAADAKTTTKTVDAIVVAKNGQKPTDPGNCAAILFAQWKHVPNVTSATVRFAVTTSQGPRAESVTQKGPAFDNHLVFIATFDVAQGSDWVAFGTSWRDGPGVETCAAMATKMSGAIVRPVTVELTIDSGAAACDAAQADVTRLQKKISQVNSKLKRAHRLNETRTIERLRIARSAYKRQLVKAQAKVRKLC